VSNFYSVGVDRDGRSAVVCTSPIALGGQSVVAVSQDGVATIPFSQGSAALVESGIEPGGVHAHVFVYSPGMATEMHRSTTTDIDVVVLGSLELELETERISLGPGDTVFIQGAVHAWHAGDDGAVIVVTLVGALPAAEDASVLRRPLFSIVHAAES
jgi:quercetin dioxygenase-like cupin family protein